MKENELKIKNLKSSQVIGTFCDKCQNIICNCKPKENLELLKEKIKYDFNCKHYFGIISAKNDEDAIEILHKNHTGRGDKLCNWSIKTKNDCQKNCKLILKKR